MNLINRIGVQDIVITVIIIFCCLFTALLSAHSADYSCMEGDCVNGVGTMTWSDGTKYTGGFKNSKLDGQGTLTDANGRYVGEFKEGNFNGQGTWTFVAGNRYVGGFKDGVFNGQGNWTLADGNRYVGAFKDGKLNGRGAYTWPDGLVYEGTFENNIPQPPFELLLPDGTKRPGEINIKTKIVSVSENSQAQSIGLKKDDIIIEYNKDIIMNAEMLLHLVSQTKPVDNVNIVVQRQGKNIHFPLKGGKIGMELQDVFGYSLKDQTPKVVAATPAEIERPDEVKRDGDQTLKSAVPAKAAFGKYYALVIGNNNYTALPKLKTARNDARMVSDILKSHYGFKVTLILDARRSDILSMLAKLRETLSNRDNLLIYYAGHGFLDKEGDEGYWLPVDATKENEINWISNSSITTQLKAMEAKHILIIADSCYSGKLGRDVHIVRRTPDYYSRITQRRTRSVIASGGLEPVTDSGGKGNHSVFASALISALQENAGIIDTSELFAKIRRPVVLNADQTPEYADIRKAGHEGGEFVFIRDK